MRKIIGNTVGTPMNPQKIASEAKPNYGAMYLSGNENGGLIGAMNNEYPWLSFLHLATYAMKLDGYSLEFAFTEPATGLKVATPTEDDSAVNRKYVDGKADKPIIESRDSVSCTFDFLHMNNHEMRMGYVSTVRIDFTDGEYSEDYMSGLSFNSSASSTSVVYTDSGIINWVGTDCTTSDGLSIFQPSPNTHYDIVFYFNGAQFVGLVNGFVPASGNAVSE